jgi:hypothetical protein
VVCYYDLDDLRGITHGRVRVRDDRADEMGAGGSEFVARDGPGPGLECAS